MIVPDFYEHYCPTKIVAGQRAISNLPFEMGRFGSNTALIVADRDVDAGLLKKIEQAFADSDCMIGHIFDEVGPRATLRVAEQVAALCERHSCDAFIAVGSQAAMDTAKAANVIMNCGKDLKAFAGRNTIKSDLTNMFAVPVTYAGGYMGTAHAFCYDEAANTELFIADERLYPKMAILDFKAHLLASPRDIAAGGMDVMVRAMDAYFAPQGNIVVDIYAKAAIEMASKYLLQAMSEGPERKDAASGLANANLFAGIAAAHTTSGLGQATAKALADTCGLEEQTAGALILPALMGYYAGKNQQRALELYGILQASNAYIPAEKQIANVIAAVKELGAGSGLPAGLAAAGVQKDKLEDHAKAAVAKENPYHQPKLFTAKDVKTVLEGAL